MHDSRVPETLDGWSLLHQMFRVRWSAWRELAASERERIAAEAASAFASVRGENGATALSTLLGHKGDLMLVHFRRDFEALQEAQLRVAGLALEKYLEPTTSYVSIVELGMYEMTGQIHARLAGKGLKTGSPEFEKAFDDEMAEQKNRVIGRLFQEVPARRHVCFYPMNKRRDEQKNWYSVPFEERARMMREHGMIGRRYAGQVTQII
jgi:peroxiredoxin